MWRHALRFTTLSGSRYWLISPERDRTKSSSCAVRLWVAILATVQSADRALAIILAFDDARPELGVTELAGELGVHKSTVSRLLATLERRGLVRRVGDRFLPGSELARLGALASRELASSTYTR